MTQYIFKLSRQPICQYQGSKPRSNSSSDKIANMGLFNTIIKYSVGLYLLSSYKSLPLAYFVRFYYYCFKNLIAPEIFGKNTKNIKELQDNKYGVFTYSSLSTYASPFECDFYFHKSNSTYFEELDISRGDLMSRIFQKLFLNSKKWPYVPVANVFTNFLKEIRPYQPYKVKSCILCWDEKWVYVMSKFIIGKNTLASLSITKYVLKDGRKTIKPKDALEFCGIYNDDVEAISQANFKILTEKSGFHATALLEELDHAFEQNQKK